MAYKNLNELPENVKDVLPIHAQEIYMKAFNNACKQYENPTKRRGGMHEEQEEVSHKVAWNAVKQKYKKDDQGNWVELE